MGAIILFAQMVAGNCSVFVEDLGPIARQVKKNSDQMKAFKLMITIDSITRVRFKVDDIPDIVCLFLLLRLFSSASFQLIESRYCNWRVELDFNSVDWATYQDHQLLSRKFSFSENFNCKNRSRFE